PTLTDLAGVSMVNGADGISLGAADYVPRDAVVLETLTNLSYCGVREKNWMYTRFGDGTELMFDLAGDYAENDNLVAAQPAKADALRSEAKQLCSPPPPGYSW
ncbi:MAG TPA: hypothetical protein VHW68_01585, partial [Actinomycetota bacterium]|nr:hypothetical protein [Actinomycetota bacterium]